MNDIVERLRSDAALPICPFDKRPPEYWTTPNDQPCKFCGGLPDGPDKCTGADTSIMREAADTITALRLQLQEARRSALEEAAMGAETIRAPKSIGRDHGRHHEAGAQSAARAIRASGAGSRPQSDGG